MKEEVVGLREVIGLRSRSSNGCRIIGIKGGGDRDGDSLQSSRSSRERRRTGGLICSEDDEQKDAGASSSSPRRLFKLTSAPLQRFRVLVSVREREREAI